MNARDQTAALHTRKHIQKISGVSSAHNWTWPNGICMHMKDSANVQWWVFGTPLHMTEQQPRAFWQRYGYMKNTMENVMDKRTDGQMYGWTDGQLPILKLLKVVGQHFLMPILVQMAFEDMVKLFLFYDFYSSVSYFGHHG